MTDFKNAEIAESLFIEICNLINEVYGYNFAPKSRKEVMEHVLKKLEDL